MKKFTLILLLVLYSIHYEVNAFTCPTVNEINNSIKIHQKILIPLGKDSQGRALGTWVYDGEGNFTDQATVFTGAMIPTEYIPLRGVGCGYFKTDNTAMRIILEGSAYNIYKGLNYNGKNTWTTPKHNTCGEQHTPERCAFEPVSGIKTEIFYYLPSTESM